MKNSSAGENAWDIAFQAPMSVSVIWGLTRNKDDVQPMRHSMLSKPMRTFKPAHGRVWVFGRNSSAWKHLRYKPN